jgi:hypothetical protein
MAVFKEDLEINKGMSLYKLVLKYIFTYSQVLFKWNYLSSLKRIISENKKYNFTELFLTNFKSIFPFSYILL